ncbi:MAG: DNA-binding protein [Candidatus Methanoplasma sp.]|jgi:predicted DNA-binding protein with PD1-like motif|nr:DNA-binding protein [Candidatus Methanoplasma sp.]
MRSAELTQGRVFILRLESGEILHEIIEDFARKNGIKRALITAVGGVDKGSVMVVGPTVPYDEKIKPLFHTLEAPHELTATGTLFPDESGNPLIHMHGSAGREGKAVTGCLRSGMIAWLVLEVTITELLGDGPVRVTECNGLKILDIV